MPRMICAWCGKDMGEAVGCSADSHGICKNCMRRQLAKLEGGNDEQSNEGISVADGGGDCGGDDCHRAVCGLDDAVAANAPGSVRVHVAVLSSSAIAFES